MKRIFQPGITEQHEVAIGYLGDVPLVECDDEPFLDRWMDDVRKALNHAKATKDFNRGEFPNMRNYSRDPQRCAYCLEWTEHPALDHIIPQSEGGKDTPDNLVPACRSCNSRKHAKSLLQFVADGGLLPMERAS